MKDVLEFHKMVMESLSAAIADYAGDRVTGLHTWSKKPCALAKRYRKVWRDAEEEFGFYIPPDYILAKAELAAKVVLLNKELTLDERVVAAEYVVFNSYYLPSLISCIDSDARHPKTKAGLWRDHPKFSQYIRHFLSAFYDEKYVVGRLGGEIIYDCMIQRNGMEMKPKLKAASSATRNWPIH